MIESFLKAALHATSGIISIVMNRPQLRIFCNWQNFPNADEVGNYLGLEVKIANTGTKPLYFERLELKQTSGATYYPIFTGVPPATEIKPNASVVGHIPVGHIASQQVVELRVFDAVERVFSLRGRKLQSALQSLEEERLRLESLGFKVHPASSAFQSKPRTKVRSK
jgi:hypothetical protein